MSRINPSTKKPLITIFLMAYNQENWVREAIRGVFDQTYRPLEIILSDDGSSDRTFQIMREEANFYSGPHKVILNQNKHNLGIARHITKLVKLACGELVVYACGDDISLPHRVQRIADVWLAQGKSHILIHSKYQKIDEHGNYIEDDFEIKDQLFSNLKSLCHTNMFVVGSTSAYTKSLIIEFPDFLPNLVHEDRCTPFRARLLGAPVVSIAEPLILYRRGGITTCYSKRLSRAQSCAFFKRAAVDYLQKKIDLEAMGRADLVSIVNSKYKAYSFAEHCADSSYSLSQLMRELLHLRPPIWFSFKQVIKFRLGSYR